MKIGSGINSRMDNAQIRRVNALRVLKEKFNDNKSEFAREIGKARGKPLASSVVRRWFINTDSRQNIGASTARAIEKAAGKPAGWMDNPGETIDGIDTADSSVIIAPMIPSTQGLLAWHNISTRFMTKEQAESRSPSIYADIPKSIEYAEKHEPELFKSFCRVPLTGLADILVPYILPVEGDSMQCDGAISFGEGSYVVIDASLEPVLDAFVIVQLTNDSNISLRQYIKEGASIYLKPLNPRYPLDEETDETKYFGVVRRGTRLFTINDE